jgi:hypothetical protein
MESAFLPSHVGKGKGRKIMSRQPIMSQAELWRLSDDKRTVRLCLPPMKLASVKRPLEIHFDFEVEMVDQILHRLSELRLQMLPRPPRQ